MDVAKDFEKELGREFNKTLPKNSSDIGKYMSSLTNLQKSITNEDYDEFFEEIEKEESKEATGSGSSGGYSAPLFGEVKKNNLFQPGTESKLTKPKGGPVTEDNIPGGLTDGMTLEDLADYHNTSIDVLIDKVSDGVNTEMEHTSDMSIALEIAMDHIYEDLDYYSKLEKIEATEATTFASVGVYDAPFGGPKKDPLKLSNPDTVEKELRSVKDKNFPKFGGPGSKFVKIKKKCKTFPYCNQGDIKALEFFENNLVREAIQNISNRFKLNQDYIKGVILENTNIYYKSTDMNKEIENIIHGIVDKVLSEEVAKKAEQITESVTEEIDEMAEFYEIAHKRRQERMEAKKVKPDFPDIDGDGDTKEPISKADEDKKKSETDEEVEEGNAYTKALKNARENGHKEFTVDGEGEPIDVEPKESVQLSEEEMIDLIEKIIEEQKISGGGKIDGVTSQNKAMKTSKKETKEYHKDLMKKFKEYLKYGSKGEFNESPTDFPKGNGELEEMEKMAYTPSEGVEEYIDQIARSGGMENLEYDQIKPDEKWLNKNIVGSSETGNSQEYANAVATDVNKSVERRGELNILQKLKADSYEKAPQPVEEYSGNKKSDKKMAGIEVNESKEKIKINEDVDRIKKLFSHNYKTQ